METRYDQNETWAGRIVVTYTAEAVTATLKIAYFSCKRYFSH